ncbi:FRG domain-containing protein [Atopococcus tabaci]|uniref:FRG domain-containing protein n=1 Tax=Atopococcus tabaci TaxID=269774 RepID=UPI00041B1896|nr:FRG domain-containing protein [Atopococcus tabaci]
MGVVTTIGIDTIEQLHEFLSPVGEYKDFFTQHERYLFRGEGSVHYPLNPSLFRGKTVQTLYRSLRKPPIDEAYFQYEETYQWVELQSLIKFFRLANNAGISVPHSEVLQSSVLHLHDTYAPQDEAWLPAELLDLFSLARHYSFPTRMIDWSDNIYTALYFACSSALNNDKDWSEDGLIVYALNLSNVRETNFPIRFVRPLHSFNENSKAQGGVLSYIETENLLKEKNISEELAPLEKLAPKRIAHKPLDQHLTEHFSEKETTQKELLHKIVINGEVIPKLYLYLDSLHYSAEKIYPDLYGVVRKMLQDEANWAKKEEKEI